MTNGHFDLIILGGGAGAFAAAIRANELGATTFLVNAGLPLGGTCVNVGCVPSKTLLWAGEVAHLARTQGIPGVKIGSVEVDFAAVVKHELELVERLRREKYAKVLKELEHVMFHEARARFVDLKEVEAAGERVTGEKFIIATGSTATPPPVMGLAEVGYLTHVEALRLERRPERLLVIGAGPLGLEFAQMYARLGSRVTVLQRGASILPRGERELASRLAAVLTGEGISIETEVTVTAALKKGTQKTLTYTGAGREKRVSGDEIIIASGKTPNTRDLGFEGAGIALDARRAVIVNQYYETSVAGVYAAGDVTNLPLRLEPTAGREGTLAAENALTGSRRSIDYRAVPFTVFTDPQYAGVGPTEDAFVKEAGVCACRTVSFADVPKAMIMGRTEGLIKMTIHPKTRKIAGIHILAPQAGELIAQAMTLVATGATIDEVVDSVPVFPTLSEAIKLAALSFTRDISKLSLLRMTARLATVTVIRDAPREKTLRRTAIGVGIGGFLLYTVLPAVLTPGDTIGLQLAIFT